MVYIKKSWQSTGNLDPGVQFPKSDGNGNGLKSRSYGFAILSHTAQQFTNASIIWLDVMKF